ncbi:biliverdin-producing heme oxygenase [Lysobacter enzymogenes]|uniref:biliverdin-producing heme oxygenase n=1 Tax=Lysobacter enzymogenes TaxID=69 RepID=UPI001A9597F3|nr:biliverdin-producing heme oxygenase [Lysobacter enzymogenes]QQP97188.1 biliverdin-producing heme oxygenase [Lysobacter enzymogenes]
MPNTATDRVEASRSQRLKAATHATHDRLDQRIMAGGIFASRDRFARFLRVQYRFHCDIDGLYANDALAALVPDLSGRRRLPQIAADLRDLGQPLPPFAVAAVRADLPLAAALGWLYVAEGSNLGGSVLYKLAAKLGLDSGFGARHLAAHPDGVARHWRGFTGALDSVALSLAEEGEVIAGAEAAFQRVRAHVEDEFA